MDSLVSSAAHLLARGDSLGALKRVALREDAPALALRGVAMAQLGDFKRARQLLRRAARAFGSGERLARARCHVAEAEVALAARDLAFPAHLLETAVHELAAQGNHANALHARLISARRFILTGDIAAAEETLSAIDRIALPLPPALAARAELTRAELKMRQIHVADAAAAFERARQAARAAGIPALVAEVDRARRLLSAPAARLSRGEVGRLLRLDEVETVLGSGDLIIDGCRRVVRSGRWSTSLAGRPVLFELARALAEGWLADVPRDRLIARAFGARAGNESHRARLRVQIGRLRGVLRAVARIESTPRGFALAPRQAVGVVVLMPPADGPASAILALLDDGESWSTSALARALGSSQRSVQRTLRQLEETAAVRSVGHGRSQRWLAPVLGGFATTLLLPGSFSLR
jgi:tetratricopeptide (TPR) repeat protein